eukprot:g860.t1
MRDAQTLPLLNSNDLALDLERQKRLAKSLRDTARAGDTEAVSRLKTHHPRFTSLDLTALKLTDAQLTVAREAGLPSWPALKRHVDQMTAARNAIESDQIAPDADLPTLHIRCGNDIEGPLQRAGFAGDFLMFADPVCQGPVTDGPNSLEVRAQFIATEYPGESYAETMDVLRQAEERLAKAGDYGRIVLWFEHDPYDQCLLVKLLDALQASGAHKRKVELISLDRFPGISKFIGIGQLSPAALRHMFDQRKPVPTAAYSLAREARRAFCAPTPLPLFDLAGRNDTLPYLKSSILRYLAELPSTGNGLAYTEHAILEILKEGPRPWGQIFREFLMERDPLPYHGDLMFLGTILRLHDAGHPAVECDGTGFEKSNWGKSVFRLTAAGRSLLEGQEDWRTCAPRQRVHGGVTCFGAPDWRWDAATQRPAAL